MLTLNGCSRLSRQESSRHLMTLMNMNPEAIERRKHKEGNVMDRADEQEAYLIDTRDRNELDLRGVDFFTSLRRFLRYYRITQEQLAENWNVSQGTVSAYIHGKRASLTEDDWIELVIDIKRPKFPSKVKTMTSTGETVEIDEETFESRFTYALHMLLDNLRNDPLITDRGTEVIIPRPVYDRQVRRVREHDVRERLSRYERLELDSRQSDEQKRYGINPKTGNVFKFSQDPRASELPLVLYDLEGTDKDLGISTFFQTMFDFMSQPHNEKFKRTLVFYNAPKTLIDLIGEHDVLDGNFTVKLVASLEDINLKQLRESAQKDE